MFEDGTPVRFWGTNVNAYSLFSTALLKRSNFKRADFRASDLILSACTTSIQNGAAKYLRYGAPDGKKLDATSMERLDWWIKCLEDEGIYVWLDLNDGRLLKAGDKVDDFAEISHGAPTAGPAGIQLRQRQHSEANAGVQHGVSGPRQQIYWRCLQKRSWHRDRSHHQRERCHASLRQHPAARQERPPPQCDLHGAGECLRDGARIVEGPDLAIVAARPFEDFSQRSRAQFQFDDDCPVARARREINNRHH